MALLRRLDPDLRAVLVDQPDLRGANAFVDPRLLNDRTRRLRGATSGPQEALTKSCLSSSFDDENRCKQRPRFLVVTTRLNLR